MSRLPDPDALLAGPLGRWLADQAAVRAAAKRKMWTRTAIGAALGVATGFAIKSVWPDADFFAWIGGVVVAFIGFVAGQIAAGSVTATIKTRINEGVAEALGFGFSAEGEPGTGFRMAGRLGLFPGYDNDICEDFWSGAFAGRPFELHEARLTETTEDSDGDESTSTKFHGLVAELTMAVSHPGTTVVEFDRRHRGMLGGQKDEMKLAGMALERVDIADPAFEAAYACWSTAPEAARAIVDAAFGSRLKAVEQAFGATRPRLAIEGDKLVLVAECTTLFESGSLDAGKDREAIAKIVRQFEALAGLAG